MKTQRNNEAGKPSIAGNAAFIGKEVSNSLNSLKIIAEELFEDAVDPNEPILEIIVLKAELSAIFDPLHDMQFPYVEIFQDRQYVAATEVASEASGLASKETSLRPTWNQRFKFRLDGSRFYRFQVCIDHNVRNRTIVGEAGFAASDAWTAAMSQKGPIALSVQLQRRDQVSGKLHLVLARYDPKVEEKAMQRANEVAKAATREPMAMTEAQMMKKSWQVPWFALSAPHRNDWAILGWTQDTWDNKNTREPPSTNGLDWAQLRTDEQEAAQRLGFTAELWEDRRKDLQTTVHQATATFFQYEWANEDLIKQAKCSSLYRAHPLAGDDGHPKVGHQPLDDVSADEPSYLNNVFQGQRNRERLQNMDPGVGDFHHEVDDDGTERSRIPYWAPEAVSRHQNFALASMAMGKGHKEEGWSKLSAHEKWCWAQLGWNEASWDGYLPPPRKPLWPQLNHRQQAAVLRLGYNEHTWNEDHSKQIQEATDQILGDVMHHALLDGYDLHEDITPEHHEVVHVPDMHDHYEARESQPAKEEMHGWPPASGAPGSMRSGYMSLPGPSLPPSSRSLPGTMNQGQPPAFYNAQPPGSGYMGYASQPPPQVFTSFSPPMPMSASMPPMSMNHQSQALPMASAMVTGVDRNRDGIPDFLQHQVPPQVMQSGRSNWA